MPTSLKQMTLGRARVLDEGDAFGVIISAGEIRRFCRPRPGCGLEGVLGLWVTFSKETGCLIGHLQKGVCDPARVDIATLCLLIERMRRHGAVRLGLSLGEDWRVDWDQYRARQQVRGPRS